MRYRQLSPTGDYTFGRNGQNFLVNSPATVGQAILTRLKLFRGEWFLNLAAGTPWLTEVIGTGTQNLYDQVIQSVIKETQGVSSIASYSSSYDAVNRKITVNALVNTIYGKTAITQTFSTTSGYGIGGYGINPYGV